MATPYKGSREGVEDAYNFYHSSVCINIECAFGMLVNRWGCLRESFPVGISVKKIAQTVRALCLLHNFCVDNKEEIADDSSAADNHNCIANGGFNQESATSAPEDLIAGGRHFKDVPFNLRQDGVPVDQLPRSKFTVHLQKKGMTTRPRPMGSTTSNN